MRIKYLLLGITCGVTFICGASEPSKTENIKFGDMNTWVTRSIKESGIIGGATKTLYEVGPEVKLSSTAPYNNLANSPWATSNVYAKVHGITKGSCSVSPVVRSGNDKALKMSSLLESVKVLGIINMKVMVAGSVFLGKMIEPVTSTSDPYSKMDMGIPFTKRPMALVFDYRLDMPQENTRIKSTGFGSKKTLPGRDNSVAFILLQRRWEDAQGNIHAKRVATGGEKFTQGKASWVNGHKIPLHYGDISSNQSLKWLGLRTGEDAYYAYNSKGKLVKVEEEGWDEASATPTHVVVLFSAGDSEPYVGTPGLNFYIDNVKFAY